MKDLQTPQKDQSRSSKHKDSSSSSAKKPQKVAKIKKNLNGELASVAGDSLPEITPDSSSQVAKKSLNGPVTPEDSLLAITSSDSSQIAKKSLNGAFTSAAVEDSLSVITSDSSQAYTTVSDLPSPNQTVTSEGFLKNWSPGRPAESVYEMENLVRQVRSRKVLEEIIKVVVAEQLVAPPLNSPPAERIDWILNYKLCVTLFSFFVWCVVVSIALPFDLGYPAGPSPT